MNTKTLTSLFADALYRIPDYQRGYAWEEKQWKDFLQDIDAVVEEKVSGHYTGTVVVYGGRNAELQYYGTKRLRVVDVVDGQQRLTTSSLYLSVIIRALVEQGELDFMPEISTFLYSGTTCKLALNNDSNGIFYDLLKEGRANIAPRSPHENRLVAACTRFREHIKSQLASREAGGVQYLKDLYHAITQQLHFTLYEIEEAHEIGMTFELMNSRGKGLSVLELLKNYLMHWVSRHCTEQSERQDLTNVLNKTWKDCYTNLGKLEGDDHEDRCLRIAWTLYCTHTPKYWSGYEGFKDDKYIPLRTFSVRTKADTKAFITKFTYGLAEISRYYADVLDLPADSEVAADEKLWLSKIHHAGNIANFLPLMVAARRACRMGTVTASDYIAHLKALECFAYRVFLYAGKRSNAGKSNFYRMGSQVFAGTQTLAEATAAVHALARYYMPEADFMEKVDSADNWYRTRHRLKYTLYEYELHLLATEGQGKKPCLKWADLSDSTIEHILPQSPKADSHWREVWTTEDMGKYLHHIGNLVLTQDNSAYNNFEFSRKKGVAGCSPSYANSDIRQERKLAVFSDWTPNEFNQRRAELVEWIKERWKTEQSTITEVLEVVDEADEDAVSHQGAEL